MFKSRHLALAFGLVFVLWICTPRGASTAGEDKLRHAFESASVRRHVPVQLLMAIGYVESRWDQHAGTPSLDAGVGIMHLRPGTGGTLELASKLTGLPEQALALYVESNIDGAAAVLEYISRKLNTRVGTDMQGWLLPLGQYSGLSDATVRAAYARDVFGAMRDGRRAYTPEGELLSLEPDSKISVPGAPVQPSSDDYGPALWVPASSNNYTVGRPYSPLNWIVIHDTEGSYYSAINWFQNPSSGVSAHYVIRSSDGEITQMVRNANTAYHAGVWDYNVRSVGVEHEGYMSQPGWYTEPMYQASSALVRSIADANGIRKDRAHVVGHSQIPNQTHRDPGPYWDWGHYMALVRRDNLRAALVDNTDPGFVAVPSQIDPQHYWYVYGGGTNGSNTYGTSSVANEASSYNSGTWTAQLPATGYYDLYAFVPYVNNSTPDTANARYLVNAADGSRIVPVDQQTITDLGSGSWAHLGRFYFGAGLASVRLDDFTGESGRNVWFDALMWIPAESGGATPPPAPSPSATRTPISTPYIPPTATSPPPTTVPTETVPPAPTFTPGPCGMNFWDLPDSEWSYQYVNYLYCRGVIGGYADGSFRPNGSSTRGQFVKMIVLGFGWALYEPGTPTYSDVAQGSTFYTYVETATYQRVVTGYADGTFQPNWPVSRAQASKMLVTAHGWPQYWPLNPTFSDVPVDHWAFSYIESAAYFGVVGGYQDGSFRPAATITRAQIAKMLTLCLQQAGAPGITGK